MHIFQLNSLYPYRKCIPLWTLNCGYWEWVLTATWLGILRTLHCDVKMPFSSLMHASMLGVTDLFLITLHIAQLDTAFYFPIPSHGVRTVKVVIHMLHWAFLIPRTIYWRVRAWHYLVRGLLSSSQCCEFPFDQDRNVIQPSTSLESQGAPEAPFSFCSPV